MRCAERRRRPGQRGGAIIVALLLLALLAIVAATAIERFGHALARGEGRRDHEQARLLARGAIDWARNILADDRMRSTVDHRGEAWTLKVPPTAVDVDQVRGEIGGVIEDWSGRFNLNNLVVDGKADATAHGEFARLLVLAGCDPTRAAGLATLLQQRLVPPGEDGARYSQGMPLQRVEQLSALPGFDERLRGALAPWIAALPAPSAVNANTAPAEVLAALIPGLGLDQARLLATARDASWLRDRGDLAGRLPAGAELPEESRLGVASRFFLVTGHTRYGQAVVSLQVLLDRRQTWPDIVWQRSS